MTTTVLQDNIIIELARLNTRLDPAVIIAANIFIQSDGEADAIATFYGALSSVLTIISNPSNLAANKNTAFNDNNVLFMLVSNAYEANYYLTEQSFQAIPSIVLSDNIAPLAVGTGNLQVGSVTGSTPNDDGSFTPTILAAQTVTTNDIANYAITNNQLALLAVASGNLQLGSVTGSTPNDDGSFTGGIIAIEGVTTNDIANNAITNNQLALLAVAGENLQLESVTGSTPNDDGSFTTTILAAQTVTTNDIANNAITIGKLSFAATPIIGAVYNTDSCSTTLGDWKQNTGDTISFQELPIVAAMCAMCPGLSASDLSGCVTTLVTYSS